LALILFIFVQHREQYFRDMHKGANPFNLLLFSHRSLPVHRIFSGRFLQRFLGCLGMQYMYQQLIYRIDRFAVHNPVFKFAWIS
jgi:hypothetical protein